MEHEAQERGQRAVELTAWAQLNQTALRQRNARNLHRQWEEANHRLENMEENDIPKLIWKMGGFDTSNVDSDFNLGRMTEMQDEAAAKDRRHAKK